MAALPTAAKEAVSPSATPRAPTASGERRTQVFIHTELWSLSLLRKTVFCLSEALALILMTRAPRPGESVPEVSVEPRPPRPCPSCWTVFGNAEQVVMRRMEPAALCLCPFIKQPEPRLSGEEPQPCLLVPKTSRSPGPALASSNRPPLSCHVLPARAPSLTLRRLPAPDSLASVPVTH